jgi:hypothetical protein
MEKPRISLLTNYVELGPLPGSKRRRNSGMISPDIIPLRAHRVPARGTVLVCSGPERSSPVWKAAIGQTVLFLGVVWKVDAVELGPPCMGGLLVRRVKAKA